MTTMRIHSVLHGSRANGPGLRSVIWVQGCSLHCPGCINPATHNPHGGTEIHPAELAYQLIRKAARGTEGITFSGGEPMESASDLLRAISCLYGSFSIGMFTGYSQSELEAGDYNYRHSKVGKIRLWDRIRATLDFAVMGRYDRTQPCNKPLVSSENQELVLLSPRYKLSDFPAQSEEVFIGPDGLTQITGFAR